MTVMRVLVFCVPAVCLAAGVIGCGDFLVNQTASLGGDTAGDRGEIRVLFINNTDYRAVLTYGSFDQTDPDYAPDYEQFGLSDGDTVLDAGESTSISANNPRASIECARVFSIGGDRLLELIRDNRPNGFLEDAMVEGVEFFEVPTGDEGEEDAAVDPVSRGTAPPLDALLGVDFPCNALLIIRFEIDDLGPDPFRIDFELIPSESDR